VNTAIFRKVSLARLASPEQLDQILRVTAPKDWVALAAVFMLLGVAVAWGYEGSIPTRATGQGVIVRSGGVLNVVSPASGILFAVNVKVRDKIKRNQVIATVEQPEILDKLKASEQQLEQLRSERDRAVRARTEGSQLDMAALDEQKTSTEQEIEALTQQSKLAADRIPIQEDLLAKGLITGQDVIAARQRVLELQGRIRTDQARLKQIAAQRYSANAQPKQTEAEMQSRISDLERNIVVQQHGLKLASSVVSPYGGEVIELKADTGAAVAAGSAILSIQREVDELEALVYLPSDKAKAAELGQEAQISPSTVKREEYGYIRAKVVYVADYPATPAALMRNFQNESLVRALTAQGPVTELRVVLEADPSTPSGFKWSSSAGPAITLSSGTICSVEVVTREQKPYTLVLPFIKEKLGLS